MSTQYFGSLLIPQAQIFFQSRLSYAIVNLKPILPGHVLVISKRVVPRLNDLSIEEVHDLFQQVQIVGNVIEKVYHAQSLTICLQDGIAAGQTIPVSNLFFFPLPMYISHSWKHVHVHIVPRKIKDFEHIDDIYEAVNLDLISFTIHLILFHS
jgi:bis(5'-adenosyl)-triphosphatase